MKKVNTVKKNTDFDRIIKNNKSYKWKDYILYVERTNEKNYHFGLSVGKKIGNAVTRNKVKRQIKSIIDKLDYQNGFNCIIIVGKKIVEKSFQEMECNLKQAFEKIDILKEK